MHFNRYLSNVINYVFPISYAFPSPPASGSTVRLYMSTHAYCMCVCVWETRVCLSAFCHPAIGDSFNCSMTTTRKDQKPHKSQSKLAAVPQWKASHAIITGKKTSSTVAQHHVYLTPIMQLCRYPNNNVLCPDRTAVPLRKTWTSPAIKECLVARSLKPRQNMKVSSETLILKSPDEFASARYIVPQSGGGGGGVHARHQ